jgi:branched-chain amino acid transport system ATP-binding protein
MSPLLVGESLSVAYGGVRAVDGFDITVEPGQILGLIGPNGAGKTSLIDGLSGFAPMTGQATFKGTPLLGLPAHRRVELGLLRTWQQVKLFDDLTVNENLQVPAARSSWRALVGDLVGLGARRPPQSTQALERLGVAHLAAKMPAELSHGQRVLVGVARAVAAGPDLILMDEPGAGLDISESRDLSARLAQIAHEGTAILLIDHDMSLVLETCHEISVLNFGKLIARGTPAEVVKDPVVLDAYLGDGHGSTARPGVGDAVTSLAEDSTGRAPSS